MDTAEYDKAREVARRLELKAMAHDRDQYSLDLFLPKDVKFPRREELVDLRVVTHYPDKWRFVDLETGHVWRYARPEERNYPNQMFVADEFCEFRGPSFWHHARG